MQRESSKNLIALCVGLTSVFIVQTMLLVAVPLYALDLGASPLIVGLALSAPYILPLIFAIPLGGLVTRGGGRRVVIVGGIGLTVGPLFVVMLPGYTGLLLSQFCFGISQLIMILGAQSIISGLARGVTLEKYFGWYTTCLSGGQLVGPLLAGWLIDSIEVRAAFIAMGAIAVLGFASGLCSASTILSGHPNCRRTGLFLKGKAIEGAVVEKSLLGYRAQARLLKTNPGVQVSIVLTVAVMFALGAHSSFLPVYLESSSFSAMVIGALISLRALSAMAVRPFMSKIIRRVGGRVYAMIISIGLAGAGVIFTGFTVSVGMLAFFSVLAGVGSGISQPLSVVVLAEHVSLGQRPSALGMRLMGNRGVQFFAPLLLGLLTEVLPFSLTFLIAGLVVFTFLFLTVCLIPAYERKLKEDCTQ
jgi:MFS family permease